MKMQSPGTTNSSLDWETGLKPRFTLQFNAFCKIPKVSSRSAGPFARPESKFSENTVSISASSMNSSALFPYFMAAAIRPNCGDGCAKIPSGRWPAQSQRDCVLHSNFVEISKMRFATDENLFSRGMLILFRISPAAHGTGSSSKIFWMTISLVFSSASAS